MTVTDNAAFEIPDFYVGVLEPNVDMSVESTWQYTGVAVVSASAAGLTGLSALGSPVSSGAVILGVLQNNPALNPSSNQNGAIAGAEAGTVMTSGISKAKAGGTVAAGQILAVTTAGTFVTAASGNYGVAMALQPSSAGLIFSVFLANYGKQ